MKISSVKDTLNQSSSIETIKKLIDSQPSYTRNDIARFLCNRFNFKNVQGEAKISSCLIALRELDKKNLICLPEPQIVHKKRWAPRRLGHDIPVPVGIPETVDKIENISLIAIESGNIALMKIFNELICSEHPLGDKRIVGRQIRYLIKSEHGWLGAVSFSSSALYLEDRDKWIGWEGDSLIQNRDLVVNMSRFLIRNSIKCKNLASFALARCAKQLPGDFEKRFGYRPLLMETFIDTESYEGTCYKAANWKLIGHTKGRGRNDTNNKSEKSIKAIYVYPLVDNFRDKMGLTEKKAPEIEAIAPTEGINNSTWPEVEFGNANLGDKRLQKRLIKIAEHRSMFPEGSYLQAAHGDRYAIKGYYNFIESDREEINIDSILSTHCSRTAQRMKHDDRVLVIQDTTELNYSHLEQCEGLGILGKNQNKKVTKGLKLHSSFTVDSEGLPLGILHAKCYAPDPSKVKKKKSEKRNTPIDEKESYRWIEGYRECVNVSTQMPDTHIINVMDREADIYELFEEAARNDNCVDLLVRAQHNRLLAQSENKLFDELSQSNLRFELEVDIPPQRKKINKKDKKRRQYFPRRKALLEVRYKKVSLHPPASPILKNRKEIDLWAVYAVEKNPPEGAEEISWFLLTTVNVASDEIAKDCIEWYRRRWRIEEWHRVLKTGLGVKKYQNKSAGRIKRRLAIDLVIGWRAMLLTICGRQTPGAPAELFFDAEECNIISGMLKKKM